MTSFIDMVALDNHYKDSNSGHWSFAPSLPPMEKWKRRMGMRSPAALQLQLYVPPSSTPETFTALVNPDVENHRLPSRLKILVRRRLRHAQTTSLDVGFTALQTLHASADVFPPLKSATGAVLEL